MLILFESMTISSRFDPHQSIFFFHRRFHLRFIIPGGKLKGSNVIHQQEFNFPIRFLELLPRKSLILPRHAIPKKPQIIGRIYPHWTPLSLSLSLSRDRQFSNFSILGHTRKLEMFRTFVYFKFEVSFFPSEIFVCDKKREFSK